MRAELVSHLTTALSTATIKCSSELPWNTAGEPLYLKNMKKFYIDAEQLEQTELIATLPGYDVVNQDAFTVTGYFAVDAKNQPANLTSALTTILNAKNQLGESNLLVQSDYTTEIQDDVLIYTVQYRMNTTS
jgi:hypothetical protein